MGEVAPNANTRAGAVRDGTLALIENTLGEISQANTSTYLGDVGVGIDSDVVKALKVDDWFLVSTSYHSVPRNVCNIPTEPSLPPEL